MFTESAPVDVDFRTDRIAGFGATHGYPMWKCFHCSFETDNYDEAAAHFGDGDGDPALCVFWESMNDAERVHEYQQMVLELNATRDELRAKCEVQDDCDLWQQCAMRLEEKLRELGFEANI